MRLRDFFQQTAEFAREASYDELMAKMSTRLRGDTALLVGQSSLCTHRRTRCLPMRASFPAVRASFCIHRGRSALTLSPARAACAERTHTYGDTQRDAAPRKDTGADPPPVPHPKRGFESKRRDGLQGDQEGCAAPSRTSLYPGGRCLSMCLRLARPQRTGGGGGKGTWGRAGEEYGSSSAALDKKDPNYDSADEGFVLEAYE